MLPSRLKGNKFFPGSSDGEESEGVGPIQESKNQRLPELHESVAEMAETGIDVSWEDGPSPLNQEAATSAASGGGHAFSSGLPGKAMPAMASQENDALRAPPQVHHFLERPSRAWPCSATHPMGD